MRAQFRDDCLSGTRPKQGADDHAAEEHEARLTRAAAEAQARLERLVASAVGTSRCPSW